MSSSSAKTIRDDLKKELGLNRTKVSVRSPHWGCVNVNIHDPAVNYDAVTAIAKRQQSVDRCEASGEILQGGNTFVFINYSDKAEAVILAERADDIAAIQKVAAELKGYQGNKAAGLFVCCTGHWYFLSTTHNDIGSRAWFSPAYPESVARALLAMPKVEAVA